MASNDNINSEIIFSFWLKVFLLAGGLFILLLGEPDLLDAIINRIGGFNDCKK